MEAARVPTAHECDDESDSEDDTEVDISSPISPQSKENSCVSWPSVISTKYSSPSQVLCSTDRAQLRAQFSSTTTTATASAVTTYTTSPPFSCTPNIPLWALGSSALKPTSSPSSSTPSTVQSPTAHLHANNPSNSVILSMMPPRGVGLQPQPLLTPLLTILPSAALMTATTSLTSSSGPQPFIIGTQKKPTSLPPLVATSGLASATNIASVLQQKVNSGAASPASSPQPEPATGQTLPSPLTEPMQVLGQVPPQRTLASIPPSEMTPQYVELKAFAEEFKTKRIRLGFTQGSVGQSLAQKGYSNFAQSTISRFEQMQLSATNAAAIKQVLEKWLQETEFPDSVVQSGPDTPMMASRKRKKRAVFTPQTKSTLDEFFRQNPRPNRQAIESIATQLDLLPEEVRVWFCNKRQKQKQSSTSSTSSYYSATSPVSANFASPRSPSLSPKRRSPSPKTSFTIEELSKSSNSNTTPSPVLLTSPFSISPTTISFSSSSGRFFPLMMPHATLPQMTITQTRA